MRETKDFKFAVSEGVSEEGKFDGYASVFGGLDSYGDTVEPGAFKKTLRENKSLPLLWSHDSTQPIGIIAGEESGKGLAIVGELNMDVASAREKRSLIRQGAVKGLSIGYEAVKWTFDQTEKVRHLKEIKLWEISLVVFPADRAAQVGTIKANAAADLPTLLNQMLTMDLGELDIKHRDVAQRAIERIQALLGKAESLSGTPITAQPPKDTTGMPPEVGHLLGKLDAELKSFRSTVDQINNPRR